MTACQWLPTVALLDAVSVLSAMPDMEHTSEADGVVTLHIAEYETSLCVNGDVFVTSGLDEAEVVG